MTRLSACSLAIAVVLGTTAMLANSQRTTHANAIGDARRDADGAYRDGLYLGQLAAASGQPLRPAVGRWSMEQDRSTFTIGYRRGYSESSATVKP